MSNGLTSLHQKMLTWWFTDHVTTSPWIQHPGKIKARTLGIEATFWCKYQFSFIKNLKWLHRGVLSTAASITALSAKMRGSLSRLRPSVTTAYRSSTRRSSHASPFGNKVGVPDFAFAFECASSYLHTMALFWLSLQYRWRPSQELQASHTSTWDVSIHLNAAYSLYSTDQWRWYTWDGTSYRTYECARGLSWYKHVRSKPYPICRPRPRGYAISSPKGSMHSSHGGESGQLPESSWRVRSGIFACIFGSRTDHVCPVAMALPMLFLPQISLQPTRILCPLLAQAVTQHLAVHYHDPLMSLTPQSKTPWK